MSNIGSWADAVDDVPPVKQSTNPSTNPSANSPTSQISNQPTAQSPTNPPTSQSPTPQTNQSPNQVDTLVNQLVNSTVASEAKDEDDALPISTFSGLHPNDESAEVTVTGTGDAIYKAASSFESLSLSPELLNGVYDMKFTVPSKIQAQSLPIIMSKNRPNLIGQAHHGSGKTAAYSLGILGQIDVSKLKPQAIVVVPTRELAIQVTQVISTIAKFTQIKVFTAIPAGQSEEARATDRGPIPAHIVVGTPGKLLGRLRDIDTNDVKVFVADEADQMIAQEGLGDQTIKIQRKLSKSTQILLFSATFDSATRAFSKIVAPKAVEIAVKTEELSLDSIKQYYMDCGSEENKYTVLTSIYGLLEIGQSIIFCHSVATAKTLANRMRADGYTVSLLHGKDMQPEERDRVMEDFRHQRSTVLITTNVLARGIDVLSVTLVVNFDVPLNRYNKPDPETYIHRIGRSGRFGRKGVAINLVATEKSKQDLGAIAKYYNKDIVGLPTNDIEQCSQIVQAALK